MKVKRTRRKKGWIMMLSFKQQLELATKRDLAQAELKATLLLPMSEEAIKRQQAAWVKLMRVQGEWFAAQDGNGEAGEDEMEMLRRKH